MYVEAELPCDDRPGVDNCPRHIEDVLAELLLQIEIDPAEEPVAGN